MAIKTFTDGTTLPASDINTYLANSGLVYITQTSFTASTAVNVSNCFSSTYDNYRIVVNMSANTGSNIVAIRFRNGSGDDSSANYNYGGYYITTAGAVNGEGGASQTSGRLGIANTTACTLAADIFGPYLASYTDWHSPHTDAYARLMQGWMTTATQYTGFSLLPIGGNNISGTVRVYGYRQS